MSRYGFFARALAMAALLTFAQPVWAQSGAVSGRVTGPEGTAVPGAAVIVEGRVITAIADTRGVFRISGLQPGSYRLIITALGFADETLEIQIEAGESVLLGDVAIARLPRAEAEVIVRADPILGAQERALNQQKTAVNIKNVVSADEIGRFPAQNSAEAVQRVPGLVIERDQGEGRFVRVRGTDPRLSSSNLNGVRLPSPEGDVRQVALDVISADLLEAIEVTKALTPDMEADAIGGHINLRTRVPSERFRFGANVNGGYANLREAGSYAASAFVAGQLGGFDVLANGSSLVRDFGSDNFEVAWDDDTPEELELRHYTIQRRRFGGNLTADRRYGNGSNLRLFGIYTKFDDQEFRRARLDLFEDGEIERELKDRYESQEIWTVAGSGSHITTRGLRIDYGLSYAYANEDEPDARYTLFKAEDVDFDPTVTDTSIDAHTVLSNPTGEDVDNYEFDEASREDNFTDNTNIAASVDVSLPVYGNSVSTIWKVGGKYRTEQKERDVEVMVGDDFEIRYADVLDPDFSGDGFLEGVQDIGDLFVDPVLASGFSVPLEKDFEEDTGDYDAQEDTLAGYAMAEIYFGNDTMVLPGFRYENTSTDYSAKEVLVDEEGDFAGITPVTGGRDYGLFMPHLHVRHRLDPDTNVRVAFTRTLSRPNFSELVPFRLIIDEDREIERGNPELAPTKSWNFDLLFERYFQTVGVISGGFFYKDITDSIFYTTVDEPFQGEEYEVTQPVNGGDGHLLGFELNYQNQFRNGFGVLANYTFTDSKAEFGGREFDLPGQAAHTGNAGISYARGGFSGAVTVNYHSEYILEIGEEQMEDQLVDDRFQLDFKATYQLSRPVQLYLNAVNLTNQAWRVYEGSVERPIQVEYYKWWISLGLNLNF